MPFKDPQKGKEYRAQRYASNRDFFKERNREYQKSHPEIKREWRKKNIEKIRQQQRDWYHNNPENVKNSLLKKSYGITIEEYNEMFEKQNGCCAICGKHQSECKRSLGVDHCHNTDKIRGLLCDPCNIGIGNLQDDINLLEKAIEYLNKYK